MPPQGDAILQWLGDQLKGREAMRHDIMPSIGEDNLVELEYKIKKILREAVDKIDIKKFLNDSNARRKCESAMNLGISQDLHDNIWVHPTMRRRIPLPRGEGSSVNLRIGKKTFSLTVCQRDILALLLERDALQVKDIVAALANEGRLAQDIVAAIGELARRSMVFLFDDA